MTINKHLPRLICLSVTLTYFGFCADYVNRRYLTFETGAYDVGVYVQPIWNFLNGRGFDISLLDEVSLRWGIHVEPILWLIAPMYALWPDPRLLLWLQVGALTLVALPLYALALSRLRSEWGALIIVMAYFLMPATQAVTLFDFHAVSFAPLFILTACYFLDRAGGLWLGSPTDHRPFTAYLLASSCLLLALSTKEDIPLNLVMLGLYLLMLRRHRWMGGLLMLVSLTWFYVAFQLIIPTYRIGNAESMYVAWFEALGSTPLEIALSPLTKPQTVLDLLIKPDTLPALLMLLIPLMGLPLLGWPFLLMTAPSLAIILLSSNPTLRQLETWHYAAPMLPFLMLATIDGVGRLSGWLQFTQNDKKPSVDDAIASAETDFDRRSPRKSKWRTAYFVFRKNSADHAPRNTQYATLTLLLLTALTYHHLRGYTPLSSLHEPLPLTDHHRLGHELASRIPDEASVLAQAQLIPPIAHRPELAIWNGPLSPDYDYIWLDVSHHKLPNRENAHGELLSGLAIESSFGFVATVDGYMLLEKGADRVPTSAEFFTFSEFDRLPTAAQPFEATFGDTFRLIGVETHVRRLATSETEPQVTLYFEILRQPEQDYHLFLYRLSAEGQVVGATDYPQPALFWWPTSRWQAGEQRRVLVNTIPWWTGDSSIFGYAIGFSRVDDAWAQASRLPVTATSERQPIDGGTLLPIAAFERWFGLPYPQPLTVID